MTACLKAEKALEQAKTAQKQGIYADMPPLTDPIPDEEESQVTVTQPTPTTSKPAQTSRSPESQPTQSKPAQPPQGPTRSQKKAETKAAMLKTVTKQDLLNDAKQASVETQQQTTATSTAKQTKITAPV